MGYRSEVAIALSPNAYNNATTEVKSAFIEVFEGIHNQNESRILFFSEYIKWYEESDDLIGIIVTFLRGLDTELYAFIRLGEDCDDTEINGSPWDYGLASVRCINIDA